MLGNRNRNGCDPLTYCGDTALMTACEELIDHLHSQARDQVHLALIAQSAPVAGMHLDLAEFSENQAHVAEELCTEE